MQETGELRVLHAYGLTVLTYGALIYVEEFEHLKRLWLWKGVLATITLHIVFMARLVLVGRERPSNRYSPYRGSLRLTSTWPPENLQRGNFQLGVNFCRDARVLPGQRQ